MSLKRINPMSCQEIQSQSFGARPLGFHSSTHEPISRDSNRGEPENSRFSFVLTPMGHWPETMMTFEETTQTRFSGDAFGGFGTHEGGMVDDEADTSYHTDEIRRFLHYYWEVQPHSAKSHCQDGYAGCPYYFTGPWINLAPEPG